MNARRLVLVALAWLCSLAAGTLLATPAALAEGSCPNAASRQGPSINLPECRVYEQVTPVNKGDALDIFDSSGVLPHAGNAAYVAEDGNAVLLHSRASLGPNAPVLEAAYVLSRGATEWSTGILSQPIGEPQYAYQSIFDPRDLSAVGFYSLSGTFDELLNGDPSAYAETDLLGPAGGPYASLYAVHGFARFNIEEQVLMVGGSEDLSSVILESMNHSLAPGAEAQVKGSEALYETTGGECGSKTAGCKLVDVNEKGEVMPCGAALGHGQIGSGGAYSAVSSDGSKIFFTAPEPERETFGRPAPTGPGCLNNSTKPQENPPELYMREGGERTVEISKPEEGVKITAENPLLPAVFVGASRDGSKVFFMTKTQLTKSAMGHTPELYEYETGSGKLTLISGGESGAVEGDVDTVGAVSSDGSAVYFSAFGKLATGASAYPPGGEDNSPVNLYRYDTLTATTTYITTLNKYDYPIPDSPAGYVSENWYESEFGGNGTVREGSDPRKEWYATGNGRFLLFGSIVPLTGFDNVKTAEEPNCPSRTSSSQGLQACMELYRYDAATNEITCVSCGERSPFDDAQFARTGLASPADGPPRPISEDGKDVFFDSANALVPQAARGKVHVYEWHEGAISLISSPSDPGNAFFLGSSADGSSALFTTHAQLAPSDTDQSGDIYDARVGGGFGGSAPPQCTGTGCQGIPAAPPIFATPSSVTFAGVGNFPASETSGKPASKPKSKPKRCRAGFVKKHGKCVRVKKKAKRSAKGRK